MDGTDLFMPVLLALATGMRRGEILALRWRDVDLETSSLTVNQAVEQTKHGLRFKPPKSRAGERTITLPSFTVEPLTAHRAYQAAQRVLLGLGKDEHDLVFTTSLGEQVDPRAFSKEFALAIGTVDVPNVTFHDLRHTHFTELLRSGVSMKVAQERAGHSTFATTMDVYTHVTADLQKDAVEKLDSSYANLLKGRAK